jgi:hypothetical protein
MVAKQQNTVQRIDADIYDIVANVERAQRKFLKVIARCVSINRWLILKLFDSLSSWVSVL